MNRFSSILLAAAMSVVAGCASFTEPLLANARPAADTGYIYGRFTLHDATTGIGHLRVGLVLTGAQRYTVEFEQTNSLVAFAVPPGTYSVDGVVFATYDYGDPQEKPIPDSMLSRPFKVEAGKAYYVGDYSASSAGRSDGGQIVQSWSLDSVEDSFESTTAYFKERYPWFERVEASRASFFDGVH